MAATEIEIKNAKYVKETIRINIDGNETSHTVTSGINCLFDGEEINAPIEETNRHYVEIKRQADAGTITIADAD